MNAEQRRRAEDTLRVVDALVKAADRREEVFRVVEDSEDVDEARRRLMELMELDELSCRAVLDMQVKGFTRERRQLIAAHAEEIRSSPSSGGEPQL
jgi:DNA gyrase/topoisomerase IV subunit A